MVGPEGKGYFIWKILGCEGGNPAAIAREAKAAGLSHVLIKVANGVWRYNFDEDGKDLVPEVAAALKAMGIEVWGWHYVFGDSPEGEADVAMRRVEELGLDGYVVDAEAEYKRSGMAARATRFFSRLNVAVPVGLSSYRYPSYHREFPWDVFLANVDFAMPQVYWIQAHNPAVQLERTLGEYGELAQGMEIVPTGAAFKEWGWVSTVADLFEFLCAAADFGLRGVNFWEWANCQANLAGGWGLIADFDWPGVDEDEEIPDLGEIAARVAALEGRVRVLEEKVGMDE